MNQFKLILDVFILLHSFVSIFLNLMIRKMGFFARFLLGVYTMLSTIILEKILMSKFITKGIKHNKSVKDLKFDELYQDFRTIFIKKIIQKKEEN